EVWADRESYALDATCGAPPDEFNPKGQDWGLPPYSPRALRASGYRPFIELLRANMPAGGALRMDHVMALSRLYWIPRGAKHDRDQRDRVGLTVDAKKERQLRRTEIEKLARALEREGFDRSARSAHAYIARTPCKIALVQPEDMLEVLEQANLPGTVEQHPNW